MQVGPQPFGGVTAAAAGRPRRRPACPLHSSRPARRRGYPARAGPYGRPGHHQGRAGGLKNSAGMNDERHTLRSDFTGNPQKEILSFSRPTAARDRCEPAAIGPAWPFVRVVSLRHDKTSRPKSRVDGRLQSFQSGRRPIRIRPTKAASAPSPCGSGVSRRDGGLASAKSMRHGVLRPHSIHAHSSDRRSPVAVPRVDTA